jgi:hypothetical protein
MQEIFKNPLSLNLYSYVENNTLIYWDPSGHTPQLLMGEGGYGFLSENYI